MGDVIEMSDYRELAVAVEGTNGKMYLLHFATLQRIIDGNITSDEVENWDLILPAILDNWLYLIEIMHDAEI